MRFPVIVLALGLLATSCSGGEPQGLQTPSRTSATPIASETSSPTLSSSGSPSASASPKVSVTPATEPTASRVPSPTPTRAPAPAVEVPRGSCGDPDASLRSFHTGVHPSLRHRTSATGFAADIRAILCDERSWIAAGTVRWRYRKDQGVLVRLLPPDEAERRCMELIGLSVARTYSCAHTHEVVINSDRWYTGAPYDWGPVGRYRQMLINHELGHILRQRHQSCERNGARAPVMMQQSKTLTSDNGKTCTANPWPLPEELARLRNT